MNVANGSTFVARCGSQCLSTHDTIDGNQFVASCASPCVGTGYLATRDTGFGGDEGFGATTTNYYTRNDPFGSNVGSARGGANWYAAAQGSCPAANWSPDSTLCNRDDPQHDRCLEWVPIGGSQAIALHRNDFGPFYATSPAYAPCGAQGSLQVQGQASPPAQGQAPQPAQPRPRSPQPGQSHVVCGDCIPQPAYRPLLPVIARAPQQSPSPSSSPSPSPSPVPLTQPQVVLGPVHGSPSPSRSPTPRPRPQLIQQAPLPKYPIALGGTRATPLPPLTGRGIANQVNAHPQPIRPTPAPHPSPRPQVLPQTTCKQAPVIGVCLPSWL